MAHVPITQTRNSLRLQLLLVIFLPLSAVGSGMVWMTYHSVEGWLEQRLQKEIELVARATRVPLERALQQDDLASIQQTLDAVFEIGRVYGAYVYDASGRRVATAGDARPGPREQIEAAELVELGEEIGRYAELAGEDVFSYFVPLTGPTGRIDGLLQVVRLESEMANRLAALGNASGLAWLVFLAVLVAVLLVGHRLAVGRHVDRLVRSMARIEGGHTTHRATIGGPAELAGVGAALNRMLDGLDRTQRELALQRRERQRLTERMRAQEHLATLGRFSSGVAHELGAPLTVIDGDTRRLQKLEAADAEARRRLARIREQIQRTRELITQLMEFARSERKPAEPVNVDRLLQRVLAAVQPECEARGIKLEQQMPESLPVVNGWSVRLEHALLNLLRNAVQAADSSVCVEVLASAGKVVIAVDDDGDGVPADQRERIFEPFHTARQSGRGTGLGLAIVKGVADEHGAIVRVTNSTRLGGTRFELHLTDERQ